MFTLLMIFCREVLKPPLRVKQPKTLMKNLSVAPTAIVLKNAV